MALQREERPEELRDTLAISTELIRWLDVAWHAHRVVHGLELLLHHLMRVGAI
tara:strand:+ start:1315 stop:1473 length:159 start_codon:yes stop_codon:yes gene_type:complete